MNLRLIAAGAAAFALACSSAPQAEQTPLEVQSRGASRYTGRETGPTPVGVIPDIRLRDNARNKDLQLNIEYPTRGGPHPLIVFSPGYGGSHRGYVGLSTYWAGNNYVVIRLNHGDQTANIQNAEDLWANATPADWRNRVRDISFVLDSLPELAKLYPELEGKIDAAKAGVAGHSYGAHTAMLIGGVRTFPGGQTYADPRVKAILVMSPQGPSDQRGFTNESWAELRVPAMFMTGSRDLGTVETETPQWRAEGFRLSPAGDKWLVTIEGAGHLTFAGGSSQGLLDQIAKERREGDYPPGQRVPGLDPEVPGGLIDRPTDAPVSRRGGGSRAEDLALRQRELFAAVRGIGLTFFDAYLRGDAAGREALEKVAQRGGVTVEKK